MFDLISCTIFQYDRNVPFGLPDFQCIEKSDSVPALLGRSIEERPESVDSREEFGHWEIDEVIGRKFDKDIVLLTMVERKTRNLCVLRLANKSSMSLMEASQRMEDELGQTFPKVFRSITTDNGSENAILADIESYRCTGVLYSSVYFL